MKPPRRLGKGLADLMSPRRGTSDEDDDASDEGDSPLILQFLSTPPVDDAVGVAPAADSHVPAAEAAEAAEPPMPTEAAPTEAAPREPVPAEPEPTPAAPPPLVAEPQPHLEVEVEVEPGPEPEPAFVDDWFDPPIAAFSPAGGFQRVDAPDEYASAPEPARPEPSPEPVAESVAERVPEAARTAPAPVPVEPPAPAPPEVPEPGPRAEPQVLLDDEFFVDDFVVGSHLPEVDLDS